MFDVFTRFMHRSLTLRLLGQAGKGAITWPQWEALNYVRRHVGCSVSDLAKGLLVSQPAATKLIDRLVLKGYTIREENPSDRRACRVSLSPVGMVVVDSIARQRNQRLSGLVQQMDVRTQAALANGLSGFLEKALADKGTPEEVCLHCGPEHEPECPVSRARTALKE